ncbi:MAG: helix-hairpin-helix domain-containing protein [Cytophagales bacterium]|nr:helix-hairpin-helix domain-containing protein [Cytophagales bacterium]
MDLEIAPILKEFKQIPGVGNAVARDLYAMGFRSVNDLKGQNAEIMYLIHNQTRGQVQDICMLYTFRCAVYFAETPKDEQEKAKLNWWNWMDEIKMTSEQKDKELRIKYGM